MATPVEMLIEDWERSKLGAQDYLDAMPEDGYSFRAVPECLTFAGQFLHLAHANYMFAAGLGAESPLKDQVAEKSEDLQTKPAATAYVLASYDYVIAAIRGLDEAKMSEEVQLFRWKMPRVVVANKGLEHQVHHRGQAAIYLRLRGIKPPGERLF